jgi:hypothetical protein
MTDIVSTTPAHPKRPSPTAIGGAELAARWNRPWNGLCSIVERSVEPFVVLNARRG